MSYYHPQVTQSPDELLVTFRESPPRQFLIGPFHFNREIPPEFGPVFLFNLPPDLYIYIKDTPIPCDIFDYLNPLILTPNTLERISFARQGKASEVKEFDCKCIVSKSLRLLVNKLLESQESTVSYPRNYSIKYQNMEATHSGEGKQICEIIDSFPYSPTPQLLQEIPLDSLSQQFGISPMNLAMQMIGSMFENTDGMIAIPNSSENE